MPKLQGLALVVLISGISSFAALADDKNFFQNYVVAHGGCRRPNIETFELAIDMPKQFVQLARTYGNLEYLDKADLFGKPVVEWSDADIDEALSVYRDCEARLPTIPNYHPVSTFQTFERELRGTIMMARNVVAQRKAQERAKIELQKVQAEQKRMQAEEEARRKENALREQAERDKKAAEEARQSMEREAAKIAEATRESEGAQRELQETEQRLMEVRKQIDNQTKARREALARKQEAERQTEIKGRTCPTPKWFLDAAHAHERGDDAAAMRIVRPLAESGNPQAQDFMARFYADGLGPPFNVPKDEAEAVKWYRRAADQGDAFALSMLGFAYRKGSGAPQDYVIAYMWFTLAAQKRDPCLSSDIESEELDYIARRISPAEIAEAQKLANEWKPGQEASRPTRRGGDSTADAGNLILKSYVGDFLYERNCGALPPSLKSLMPVMERMIVHEVAGGLVSAGERIGQMQLTIEMVPDGKKEFCENWSRDWSHGE